MEYVVVALTTFAVIALVELPDKTFVATLVLSTRFPALPVWLGVITAFAVQSLVAVAAGSLLSRLPERPVQAVAALLFAVGAALLIRGAREADAAEAEQEREFSERAGRSRVRGVRGGAVAGTRPTGWRAAATSFLILFTAEWGDLSQLLTAGLVASGQPAVPVFIGAWLALAAVSGAAVLLGRWLLGRVRLPVVRYVAAGVCTLLAVITFVDIVRG